MRIAFTSYEYPEETGGGGIGTYLQMVTGLLKKRGHTVVVFSGTSMAQPFWENESVFRIPASGWKALNEKLPNYFLPLHQQQPFDVLECTDFEACGLSVKLALPNLPVVVRLHTPLFLVDKLLYQPLPWIQKLRFLAGGLIRGKITKLPPPPRAESYATEFKMIDVAEVISSPGHSIYTELKNLGFGVEGKTEMVPLPFDVTTEFKKIVGRERVGEAPQIVFIGRLESRKGVIDLADAIPGVLNAVPGAHFTFIGASALSPQNGLDMTTFLKLRLRGFESAIHFTGKIGRSEVMAWLEKGDIFIFPSHYESFGLVCCEAMAAGKAVIGSSNGGMSEIIEDGKSGILVAPNRPEAIKNALLNLISDDTKRVSIGTAARQRIEEFLSPAKVIDRQLNCYQMAIDRCSSLG